MNIEELSNGQRGLLLLGVRSVLSRALNYKIKNKNYGICFALADEMEKLDSSLTDYAVYNELFVGRPGHRIASKERQRGCSFPIESEYVNGDWVSPWKKNQLKQRISLLRYMIQKLESLGAAA